MVLALSGGMGVGAQAPEPEEDVDWPTVIIQLKRQYHQRPGRAHNREQLAVAYNNYGVELMEGSKWTTAIQQFTDALRLDPENANVTTNLSHLYYRQAEDAYERRKIRAAVSALKKAIEVNPDLVEAYVLLGRIEYDRQKLKEAKVAWERVMELDPTRTNVADRLRQLTDEVEVESGFERLSQAFFDLRYEGHLARPVGWDIRDALLQARRLVGSDFAYRHKYKIVVLIYSAENFRKIRKESPEWMGGQFDGKIRMPLPSAEFDKAMVRGILFHEYTHAVIRDLTNGACPTWLNAGLAEYEGRTQFSPPLRRLAEAYEADRLIPWSELSDHIGPSRSADEVGLAYEQSYSLVAYLVDRYRFWKIRRLLSAIAEGQPWEEAVEKTFRTKLPRLEKRWREQLPTIIAASRATVR